MRLTNNQIAFIAIMFTIVSLVCNIMIYQRASTVITGRSTATGQLSICLNRAPVLSISCGSEAIVGHQYSCGIDASDQDNTITAGSQTLTFSDDTDLFDINPTTGIIQFTPTSSQVENYTITITVEDNSTCANSVDSGTLSLSVKSPYCGDGYCNGAETCSSCPEDCGICAEAPVAAPGGGGGGAGPGESAKGCHVDFCKIDSKTLRTKEKGIVFICFRLGYKLSITKVNKNSFTMVILDTKEKAVINLDEKKIFDINKDGLPDMSIQLVKIMGKDIWLFLEPMEGAKILCKKIDALKVEPSIIRISIKLGDIIEKSISISNMGSDTLKIDVELQGLDKIIKFKEDSFSLQAFQSRIFNVIFDATEENLKAGVYNGKIIFRAENIKKEVSVIVEVETKRVIFDVKVNIPSDYKKVTAGEDVLANIDLYNLEKVGRVNVGMVYQIRDSKGSIIVNENEIIMVEGDVSFVKKLRLPKDIEQGEYVFVVIAKYANSVGTASDVFEVIIEEILAPPDYASILVLIIIILIIMATIFGVLVHRQHKFKMPITHYEKKERRKELERKKRKLLGAIKDEIKDMKKEKIDVSDEESILKRF